MNSVSVVIPNHNGSIYIRKCLDSIIQESPSELIIVDDCSNDNSVDIAKEEYPEVKIIQNFRKIGSAEAKNMGIRVALQNNADYIAFHDIDTESEKNWLTPLLTFMKKDQELGAVGSLILNWNGDRIDPIMMTIRGIGQNTFYEHYKKSATEVFYCRTLIGASMLFRTSCLKKIGLFDPGYGVYYEETDLCRRLLYHGYHMAIVPSSRVKHKSTMNSDHFKVKSLLLRNSLRYGLKNPNHRMEKKIFTALRYILSNMEGSSNVGKYIIISQALRTLLRTPEIYLKTRSEKRNAPYI